MSKIFISGSSDGLGFLAGKLLFDQGHSIVLHARNEKREREVKAKLPGCEAVVIGDVSQDRHIKYLERVTKLRLLN